ncbi:MAG: aspartate/glutamate racemase family protein [Chloroflexota bacterium]
MAKTVAVVHTAASVIKIVGDAFKEQLPDVELLNILDDSVVQAAVAAGSITDDLARRMYYHYAAADTTGADLILVTCSTVGETADIARPLLRTPILKIDEPMAEKAVSQARRIGVLATVSSTLGPTSRLLHAKAAAAGREVQTVTKLAEGAFQALSRGDTERHDNMVLAVIDELAKEVDTIVFAQASMVRLLPQVSHVSVPILSSPNLAVARIAELLSAH